MDSILFILVLVCLLLVAGWYVGAEMRGDKGERGLLGVLSQLRGERPKESAGYREKRRPAADSGRTPERGSGDEEAPAYTAPGEAKRFREKEEPGYRTRGPLPRFGERSAVDRGESEKPADDNEA